MKGVTPDRGPPEERSTEAETIQSAFVDAVREIETPHGDPVAAELLCDVDIDSGIVTAVVDLSGIRSDVANRVCDQLTGAGLAIEGVEHVRVESSLKGQRDGEFAPDGADAIVAVCGAKGGVGKTALTIALARKLSRDGLDVGIFDADVETPDVSPFLGIDDPVTASPTGNPNPVRADGIEVVGVDRVAGDRPTAWRGAMVHDVIADLLGKAAWSDRDVLLLDLPSGLGDVAGTVFQRVPIDGALLVTTGTDASLRHAERTAGLLEAYDVSAAALVENAVGQITVGPNADGEGGREQLKDPGIAELQERLAGDPAHVAIPFDPGLRQPAAVGDGVLAGDTEAALESLAEVVSAVLARVNAAVPEDAVDLSGLPERFRERQAILEVASAPDGPRPLVGGGDGELADLLAEEFDREISTSDLEDGRQLVHTGV